MSSFLRPAYTAFLLLIASLLFASPALSQVATGTPAFGSYAGGPDTINLGNLNAQLPVFLISRPGRVTDFTYELTYDSAIWAPVTVGGATTWNPVANYGWRGRTEVMVGYMETATTSASACNGMGRITYYTWTYHDMFGIAHRFSGTSSVTAGPPGILGCEGTTGFTSSSDQYTLTASGSSSSLYSNTGTSISAPPSPNGSGGYTDRNGNQLTTDGSGHFYDTQSSTVSVLTISGSGTPSSPMAFSYTPPGGSPHCNATNSNLACYALNYTNFTVATNFGFTGTIGEFRSTAAVPLVTSITLPDGSSYSFSYEATPGSCTPYTGTTCTTARVTSIALPTGGSITYSYAGAHNGINSDGSTVTLNRTLSDGAGWSANWSYTRSLVSGTHWQTVVTDPNNNQTAIDFQNGGANYYETQRRSYSGSTGTGTLQQTTDTCYNGAASPCTGTSLILPISTRTVAGNLPGSTLTPKRVETWVGLLPTEVDEYDFGGVTLLRKTLITYAALQNNINAFKQTITVCSRTGNASACGGTGTVIAQTTNTYDQGSVSAHIGTTPQHTSVTGSRGNLTTVSQMTAGSSTLNRTFTYYDTGMINTAVDVNGSGSTVTFNYPNATDTCGNAFPTSITEPLSLSRSMTWNCTGGVQLTATDENLQTVTTTYNDPYFWRPRSVSDQLNNQTNFGNTLGGTAVSATLQFNSNNSLVGGFLYFDGLGRVSSYQRYQSPSLTTYDTVSNTYDALGRPSTTTVPCSVASGLNCPNTTPKTTMAYDVLGRVSQVTDGGSGWVKYTYSDNDVGVEVGPNPTGENTKRRQLEYDALGRLTSVCELTTATGSGSCSQTTAATGFLTKYTYDLLGNLTGVTQNAQAAAGSQQTRSFNYDALSRLTSENNPESGTTTYSWDTASGTTCQLSSPGDLLKRVDANGNWTCYNHDALHRLTDVGNNNQSTTNPCKRFRYDNTSGVLGSKPSGVTVSNVLGRLVEVETDTCVSPITQSSIITDEWFSYNGRGEISDFYQSTPHSGGWLHSAATYWANGALASLTGYTNGTSNYSASWSVDGAGRPFTNGYVNATPAPAYNAAGQLTQLNLSSGDSDSFTYDPNTGRMTQYKYTVNNQSVIGNLTWNQNGTLAQLAITDPFDSQNAQTCTYAHDDLTRLASVSCPGVMSQTFGYDVFGNISANGTWSYQPTYSPANNNRVSAIGNCNAAYDANGNPTNDCVNTYAWDAYGHATTIAGSGVTYDALGRMVEVNIGNTGTYTQRMFSPNGFLMEIPSLQKKFVPLPGGMQAVYLPSAPGGYYYRHTDWLGSARFASTPTRTMYYDGAYAPFGQPYANVGSGTEYVFTGQENTFPNSFDFPARNYTIQGRWSSPDPAGLAAVNAADPQSWNRYAYVRNNPLNHVDPTGLCDVTIGGLANTQDDPAFQQYTEDYNTDGAYPYADIPVMGSLTSEGDPAAIAVVTDALTDALAQTPGNQKVNVVTFSGGAGAFAEAYSSLEPAQQARIGNITYLSPGSTEAMGFETLPSSQSGTTAVWWGHGAKEKAVNSSVIVPIGTEIHNYNCGHSSECAFSEAWAYLVAHKGPACRDRKIFSRPLKPPRGGGGGGWAGIGGSPWLRGSGGVGSFLSWIQSISTGEVVTRRFIPFPTK